MNVVTALRADEDIGPYQLLRPQLCDITNRFASCTKVSRAKAANAISDYPQVGYPALWSWISEFIDLASRLDEPG